MEAQDISLSPGEGNSTAWGAAGDMVLNAGSWLLKLPHSGDHVSVLHFSKGWEQFCCHMHSTGTKGKYLLSAFCLKLQ